MSIFPNAILGLPNWVTISLALLASICLLLGGFIGVLIRLGRTQDGLSTYLQGNIGRAGAYAGGEPGISGTEIRNLPEVA